jgi:NAD(P)-dependent dehydrogenase (short-subunit alcohol dehydrogenase family)
MVKDLEGKVFVVTGATEGIGKAAAIDFARRGATLGIVGRNPEKTERVASELREAAGEDTVSAFLGDLSRLSEVRSVASAIAQRFDRVDVLANNAGAIFEDHALTPEGFEMTFALNHLSYFLLTQELLPLLKQTRTARIVSTSSDAHKIARLNVDDVAVRADRKAGILAYADSKLANILFARELSRRLAGTGITSNSFHPGVVNTGFAHNNSGVFSAAVKFISPIFGRTPEKGAQTLVWLATSREAAEVSGEYFKDRRVVRTTMAAKDDTLSARLWALSERLCAEKA